MFTTNFIKEYYPFVLRILAGTKYTIIIALLAAICGIMLGTLLALMKSSKIKVFKLFASFYTDIFRGTPVILQLSLIHYVVFGMVDINPVYSAIVALSLNSAAYLAEIIRAGINGVDRGQVEAAEALGVPKKFIIRDIILPLSFRKTIPPIINEFAALIKESSIVYIIGVADIMLETNRTTAKTFMFFEPLIIASLCYYVLVKLVIRFGKFMEGKLNVDRDQKPVKNI